MNSDITTNSIIDKNEVYLSMSINNINDINDIIINDSFLDIIDEIFNNEYSNNEYIANNNGNIVYHIYYDIIDSDDDNNEEENLNNDYYDKESDYFINCKEINSKVCKPVRIKENDDLIINKECCNICCEDYITGQYKRILPSCTHVFHKKCVDKWLKSKSNCPICRNELKK
jgi:hypothetical protein